VSQEHQEEIIRHVGVSGHPLCLLRELVRESSFKVSGPGSQDDLVTVDGLSLDHKGYVAELWLVENAKEVLRVVRESRLARKGLLGR